MNADYSGSAALNLLSRHRADNCIISVDSSSNTAS